MGVRCVRGRPANVLTFSVIEVLQNVKLQKNNSASGLFCAETFGREKAQTKGISFSDVFAFARDERNSSSRRNFT